MREHFPVWWNQVSSDLHANGYNLPEMNEYDKAILIQASHTQFDNQILWIDINICKQFNLFKTYFF